MNVNIESPPLLHPCNRICDITGYEKILEVDGTVTTQPVLEHVVSNLSFNISSTDVIKLLLPMRDILSEVVLLLQEESALRLVDPSLRTSEYRPINIFINFYSGIKYVVHKGICNMRSGQIILHVLVNKRLMATTGRAFTISLLYTLSLDLV
ncbi:hypothetical protein OROGR_020272 [Orobanche gracilis]